MLSLRSRTALYLIVFALTGACCYAQSVFSGNIQGVISDPSGAIVPSVSVVLHNVDTGVTATETTSGSGNYRFNSLPPGNYIVSAEAPGFSKSEIKVTLETNQTQGINIALSLTSSATAVSVVGEAPPLDTDDSRIQATLNSQTVRDLPSLNRNLWDVLAVAPGIVGTGTHGSGESPGGGADNFGTQTPDMSANGRSYTGNRVVVDGMDVTSNVQNGNVIYAPPPDAVQEVSMQANSWDAENNLGSSILVQVTTKSGTNQFHGTGDYLFTNQDMLARTVFTPSSYNPFKRQDLVATFGGPIIKNKTFFFAETEALWSQTSTGNQVYTFESPEFVSWATQNLPSNLGSKILTSNGVTGITNNGVATLSNGQPATAANYFAAFPGLTSLSGVSIPSSLPILDSGVSNLSPPYNATQYGFRVDQYVGSNDRIYGNYANDSFTLGHPANVVGFSNHDIMANWYAQANWTHTFSATMLNEMGFAANSVGGANGQGGTDNVPDISVTGQSLGFNSSWGPGEYRAHNYNWREVLSWVRGAHTLKFGANGSHAVEFGNFTPVNNRPGFTFDNLLDLVEDAPYSESFGAINPLTGQAGLVLFDGQENPWGLFVEDDWKAKSNLSFTFSLRWDDYSNITPEGPAVNSGVNENIILGSGNTIAQQIAGATVQTVSGVYAHPIDNIWSPRVGFAWDPSKRGVWSIRGGVGVFHDWITLGQAVDEMRTNPPSSIGSPCISVICSIQPVFAEAPSATYPYSYPLPAIPITPVSAAGGYVGLNPSVWGLSRNLTAPLAVNYVVGVERELPWKFVAGGSYSGSKSYNGLAGINWNRADGDLIANGGKLVLPNDNFGTMNYVSNILNGSYNAMIVTLRRTVGSAATFQTSYTLARAMSDINANTRFDHDGGFNVPDPAAYSSYYAPANWDVRNRFSFSGVYTIPGMKTGIGREITSGWEVSVISAIQSGTPFWVNTTAPYPTGDYNADGTNYDIPNAATGYCSGGYNEQQYLTGVFPASTFTAPAAGTEGNVQRNSCRNPGLVELDASVLKNIPIRWLGEHANLRLRFDFENVLNKVNLTGVDPDLADATFAKSTSQNLPRTIQLGARLAF
jgi:hypothetical protein